jgi:hypothetical protein
MPLQYNPTDSRFLTVAQSRTNNGQKDIRIILDIITNDFYSLDDDGNFNIIGGGGSVDYTEYVAFVTQNGATTPTAVVEKNDTGFSFSYNRTGVGELTITATGAFPDKNKVIPYFNSQTNQGFTSILWNNINVLEVFTTDTSAFLTDGQFTGNLVIRIYN